MALQLRWQDRFINPDMYEAASRQMSANSNNPAVRIQAAQQNAPASPAVQRVLNSPQAQAPAAPSFQAPRFIAPSQNHSSGGNIWSTLGDILGANELKRIGEGTAEVFNELSGNAQKERDANTQRNQQDLALIKHYGDLIKNGDPATQVRARQALSSLMKTSSAEDQSFQQRQQQIIERTDPVKAAGAIADLVLTYGTLGVGGAAAKAAAQTGKIFTKQAAKEAALGSFLGAGSGIAGAYEQNGAAANQDPNTFNSALIGGAIGGVLPTAGRVIGKTTGFLANKAAEQDAALAARQLGSAGTKAVEDATVTAAKNDIKTLPKVTQKPKYKSDATELAALNRKAKSRVLNVAEKQRLDDLKSITENPLTKPSARLKKGQDVTANQLESVDANDVFNNRNIINKVRNDLSTKFLDSDSNMFKLLGRIEKETGRTGLVDQYYYDTGRIKVANAIADARITGSQDVADALRGLQDYTKVGRKLRQLTGGDGKSQLDRFDDYAAARAELQNYKGMKTSKSREELAGIVVNGHEEFGKRFDALNRFYKDQAKYLYENGVISKKKLDFYQKSPDYIRIQRDVEDLVQPQFPSSKSRSFGSTSTGQRRTGSTREVLSPTRSLLERAQQLELEVQRNRTANHTIDVLSEYGLAKRVGKAAGKNTVARFRGGKKEFWEVPGDIKKEMDNLNPNNLGVTLQIIGAPVRLLRSGATGLNVPFAAANYVKDQVGSAIQSKNALATHNPFTIVKALGSAARDIGDGSTDPLWKKFEEFTGNQTIYDELRNQKATKATMRELRMGTKGVLINRAISPVRSLEDLIGVTEKATRFQNFKGTYTDALKRGLSEQDALREATLAARKNTTDFARSGEWGRVINQFVPYFNASIQGTRTMARSFKERPVATSVKTVGTVALPTVAATLWNYADPARAEAYNSIDDYEKKDNWIIIGPNAHQNKDGSWSGVVKIPKPPGYRDLTDPVRDVTESFAKGQPAVDVQRMLGDVLNALGGPIQSGSPEQLAGSLLPQQIKPFVQAAANKNFYTGKDIVPDYINQATHPDGTPVANQDKAYADTSGSARALGKLFGVSPLIVNQFIKDAGASVGQYLQNTADTTAAQAGLIPKNQVGGKSIAGDIEGRFMKAQGEILDKNKTEGQKYFEARKEATKSLNANELAAFNSLHPQTKNFLGEKVYDTDSIYNSAKRLSTYNAYPAVFQADKELDAAQRKQGSPGNPLFDLSGNDLKKVLEKENLPPGAKDPELSSLYNKDWYVEYQNKKSAYFDYVAKQAAADGKPLGGNDNPYPTTPPDLQKSMDYYNSLPKGTGARSGFIKANPGVWQAMQNQYAAVDNWQNKQRAKRGLDATEGSQGAANGYSTGSSSSSYSSRGGGRKTASLNPYGYQVKRGSASIKVKSPAAKKSVAIKVPGKSTSKPKVSLKKAVA